MDIRVLSVRLHRTQRRLRPAAMFYFYMPARATTLCLSMNACNVLTRAGALGDRQHDSQACASSATRPDTHCPAQSRNALSHSQQAERLSSRIPFSRKSDAVIVDQQTQRTVLTFYPQTEIFCLGMFSNVVQRFLYRTVNRDFNLVIHFAKRFRQIYLRLHARMLGQFADLLANGGEQAEFFQGAGGESSDDAAQISDGTVQHGHRFLNL